MFLDILYNLFITPIQMIIEFVFSISYRLFDNPGLSIIAVSIVVNILVLPLYKKADALQEEERNKQAEMKPWLDHIKKTFKGDKRYMITQTYYRLQGYKPIYALRSSISLLLQIPFFIAAYKYLSNLGLLDGASFLFFSDLSKPDGLIPFFGGTRLNLLPILMTAINICSGMVYSKGLQKKDKIQMYLVALVFLVLLYNSPSGLVFYWTLNNIFSLCKNVVMKKLPEREKKKPVVPLKFEKKYFFLSSVIMAILLGIVIPISVIAVSPDEFTGINQSAFGIIIYAFSVYVGVFLVWLSIFYYLSSNKARNILTVIMWALCGVCFINYYIAARDYGNLDSLLVYVYTPNPEFNDNLLNMLAVIVVAEIFILLIVKLKKIVKAMQFIMIVVSIAIIISSMITIIPFVKKGTNESVESLDEVEPVINLSKTGKNVVLIELDRATGLIFEDTLNDNPWLEDDLDGFTWYRNTISYGIRTNYSTPSLYGGYEYTPQKINARADESLKDKHNEAVLVLPTIFRDNGYFSTAIDIPYAGSYEWIPDMTIYDQEGMQGYKLEGKYTKAYYGKYLDKVDDKQNYNMVRYSIFRSLPKCFHNVFYDEGKYLTTDTDPIPNRWFLESDTVLQLLPNLTTISESGDNFLMMQNTSTHEPSILSVPEYTVTDEYPAEALNTVEGEYYVHVSSVQELGTWFDYLKKEGVFDNTRIIITGDHGTAIKEDEYAYKGLDEDLGSYNPVLLVKDFNQSGFTISDEFMTLADIATIATEGVISNPTNPFTGEEINSDEKLYGRVVITSSSMADTLTNNGNVFDMGAGKWYEIVDRNIFHPTSFKKVEAP